MFSTARTCLSDPVRTRERGVRHVRQKRIRRIQARYGKDPGTRYEEEDLREIRAYADSRIQADPALFALDEITWADLSMDTVFERICGTDSAAGEQVLYAWLRCPAMEAAEYGRRRALIRAVEADPDLRLKLQLILSKIGKSRAARTAETFAPGAHGKRRLAAALLLSGGLAAAGLGLMLTPACLPVFVALLCLNPLYHIAMVRRLDAHLPAVNSSVALAAAFQRILALGDPGLSACLRPYEAAGRQTHRLARMGGVSLTANHEVMQLLNGLFLFDLILYEWLKVRLYGRREAVSAIHEAVGSVDAAIAVASYRAGAGTVCDPELRFGREEPPRLTAVDLVHPLLRRPVGNTLELDGPLLLTGSNASGKSTLLKAAVLAAVMAQGICTAPCSAYSATAFRLYTSMAVSDELFVRGQLFRHRAQSVPAYPEAAGRGERVLCAVDEVLRGRTQWSGSRPRACCSKRWPVPAPCASPRRTTASSARCWKPPTPWRISRKPLLRTAWCSITGSGRGRPYPQRHPLVDHPGIRSWIQRPRQSPCRRVWTDRAMAGRSRGLLKPAGLAGFLWDRHRRTTYFSNL